MTYLASPYTHKNKLVEEERFNRICKIAAQLIVNGHIIYCPIAHCHPIATKNKLLTTFDYWKKHNKRMLELADKLLVVKMEGWEGSVGINAEIFYAKELGIPIEFMEDVE